MPSFIDWTQFRSLIEAQASRATGRQVSIRGDISLNLLPAPAFELGDVTMADPTDSKAPLLSAETIETVAAWGPLLKGEIEIAPIAASRANCSPGGFGGWAHELANAVGFGDKLSRCRQWLRANRCKRKIPSLVAR